MYSGLGFLCFLAFSDQNMFLTKLLLLFPGFFLLPVFLDTYVRIYFKIHVAPVITHLGKWLVILLRDITRCW